MNKELEHYYATGKIVSACNCTVYNLPSKEVLKYMKRGNKLFKGKVIKPLDGQTTLVYDKKRSIITYKKLSSKSV